jgi:hypothetical protein
MTDQIASVAALQEERLAAHLKRLQAKSLEIMRGVVAAF